MDDNQKMLIVGATGFLGQTLCDLAPSAWQCVPASRQGEGHVYIDLTDEKAIFAAIETVRPRWVINTAAMTSVDGCERDPGLARAIHVGGTEHLVRACEQVGCGLITLSTNYVFEGTLGQYGEQDAPYPPNVYGQSKLDGEAIALQARCPHIVIRTAVLYGYRAKCRPNFVTWVIGALAQGEAIRVVTDEWSNPTYVDDLAQFILSLCDSKFQGLVHFGGPDFMTRFEMVERICDRFDFDRSLVSPVTSADFGQPAKRPLRAGLKTDLASQISSVVPTDFDSALAKIQKNYPIEN